MLQKKDIKLGDIVRTNNGNYYIYVKTPTFDFPVFCRRNGYLKGLIHYTTNLKFNSPDIRYRDFDIVEIFKPKKGYSPVKSVTLDCWEFPFSVILMLPNYQKIIDSEIDKHFINLLDYV